MNSCLNPAAHPFVQVPRRWHRNRWEGGRGRKVWWRLHEALDNQKISKAFHEETEETWKKVVAEPVGVLGGMYGGATLELFGPFWKELETLDNFRHFVSKPHGSVMLVSNCRPGRACIMLVTCLRHSMRSRII